MPRHTVSPVSPAPRRMYHTCGQLPSQHLKRGRRDACYAYWYRCGRERAPHLRRRNYSGLSRA